MASEAMTLGRLRRATQLLPADATLHGYLHPWGMTVQAEWVEDDQIYNPVILRIPFDLFAGGTAEAPAEMQSSGRSTGGAT